MRKKLFSILFILTGLVIAFFATRQTDEEAEAYKSHLENTYNRTISHQKETSYWCGYADAILATCTNLLNDDAMAKCAEKADEVRIRMGVECRQDVHEMQDYSPNKRHEYSL